MSEKSCVLSFATVDRNYPAGIKRISKCLARQKYNGDFLSWVVKDKYPEGCPSHQDVPWGFKAWALETAINKGYTQILWIDTSIIPVDIEGIFKVIKEKGYFFVRETKQKEMDIRVGEVISDAALESLGVSRDEAMNAPQFCVFCLGFDLRNEKARQFLDRFIAASKDGVSFKGYKGEATKEKSHALYHNIDGFGSNDPRLRVPPTHKWEQSCGSLIAHLLDMELIPENPALFKVDRLLVKHKFHKRLLLRPARYLSNLFKSKE